VNAAETRQRLAALHEAIDARSTEIVEALPGPLNCRLGCADCCVDDLTVFSIEADLIRHHHAEFLAAAEPHSPGACAFLGPDGGCRIYKQRPYVCRTQGLPLRWLAEDEAGEVVEMRDICPLNEEPLLSEETLLNEESPVTPIATLDLAQCWELGPYEGQLASLQAESQGGFELTREPLRGLFGQPDE
jgi:Fe-S-cluster containining protein